MLSSPKSPFFTRVSLLLSAIVLKFPHYSLARGATSAGWSDVAVGRLSVQRRTNRIISYGNTLHDQPSASAFSRLQQANVRVHVNVSFRVAKQSPSCFYIWWKSDASRPPRGSGQSRGFTSRSNSVTSGTPCTRSISLSK